MPVVRTAVAIGSFDGVHLGHQKVVAELLAKAGADALQPVVVSFEPLPREHFGGAGAPRRIQGLRDRVVALRNLGVARTAVLRFRESLANELAEHFVERVLVKDLAAAHVVVGEDFRFGRGRAGDIALLQSMGRLHGFSVAAAPTVIRDDERVSSTRIRALLGDGDLASAARLLGRPYRVSGRVVAGEQRGRSIGFPTANIAPARPLALADGVYATRVRIGNATHIGAAHCGRRSWLASEQYRVEVHLLDFAGDLYGQRIEVEFERFVRPDQEFGSIEAMRHQIEKDIGTISDRLQAHT